MNEYPTAPSSQEVVQAIERRNTGRFSTSLGNRTSPQNPRRNSQPSLEAFNHLSVTSPASHVSPPRPSRLKKHRGFPDCSPEQNDVLSLVARGENVFFTGSAGVGKSFIIRKMKEMLKDAGMVELQDFFVTASTG
jgi:hypothetical protein